jgi:ribonuclease Z
VDLDVVFLGTSGATPTAQRAPAATLVRRGGERLLFDCAEGTQRQFLRCDIGLVELREVSSRTSTPTTTSVFRGC